MRKLRCYVQRVRGYPSSYGVFSFDNRLIESGFSTWIEAQNWGTTNGYEMDE